MEQDNSQFKKPRRSLNEDTSHQRNRPPTSSSSAATSNNGTFIVQQPNGRSNNTALDASAVLRQIDDATATNLSSFKRKPIGSFLCHFFVNTINIFK